MQRAESQHEVNGVDANDGPVAVADDIGKVRIFDVASGVLLNEFQSVATPIDMAWNPATGALTVLSYNTELQLWSVG